MSAWPMPHPTWLLPKPVPEMNTTLACLSTKSRWNRFWMSTIDLGGPVPVELIERLEHGEACQLDAALDAAIVARGGLAAEQLGEVVQVRPLLVGGGLRQGLVVLEHERQVQCAEVRAQCVRIDMGLITACWHRRLLVCGRRWTGRAQGSPARAGQLCG